MYRMSKKSLTGRIIVAPLFFIVLVVEATLNKADDWNYYVRRIRIKMTDFVDKKFPSGNNKKTSL
ncbi:hypothetical protein PRB90_gp12 [Klebsiella phage BUCT610]|uniref:hypothetical protein n=1 Tax=Klebsiella phage BUCT610 TaxID=2834265 RepID=UPI001C748A30|nr:hypothetical protein PRB90_gp12 [Klebsiella phage BUCT610]QWX10281.1 hypothetical protein [Klebsiella phage BUCT610]